MAKKSKNNKNKKTTTRNTRSKIPTPARPRLRFSTTRLQPIPARKALSGNPVTPTVRERTVIKYQKPKPLPKKPQKNKYTTIPLQHAARAAKTVSVCKRRTQRKEIIHALGFSGKSGQKKPNNKNRDIQC